MTTGLTSQSYDEYPFSADSEAYPGAAGWFLFRDGRQLEFSGRQTTVELGPRGLIGHGVELEQAWNMVGNPFNDVVSLADAWVEDQDGNVALLLDAANTITDPVFWVYENGDYVPATDLPPFGGGWVKKTNAGWGRIFFPSDTGTVTGRDVYTYDTSRYERPPAPPKAMSDAGSGPVSGGGGGGGGCFISAGLD
jgi:hypothetical protein